MAFILAKLTVIYMWGVRGFFAIDRTNDGRCVFELCVISSHSLHENFIPFRAVWRLVFYHFISSEFRLVSFSFESNETATAMMNVSYIFSVPRVQKCMHIADRLMMLISCNEPLVSLESMHIQMEQCNEEKAKEQNETWISILIYFFIQNAILDAIE